MSSDTSMGYLKKCMSDRESLIIISFGHRINDNDKIVLFKKSFESYRIEEDWMN